jgi:hypothetical protein
MSTSTVMNYLNGGKFTTRKELLEMVTMDTIKAMIEDGTLKEHKPFKPFKPYRYCLTEKGQNINDICDIMGVR